MFNFLENLSVIKIYSLSWQSGQENFHVTREEDVIKMKKKRCDVFKVRMRVVRVRVCMVTVRDHVVRDKDRVIQVLWWRTKIRIKVCVNLFGKIRLYLDKQKSGVIHKMRSMVCNIAEEIGWRKMKPFIVLLKQNNNSFKNLERCVASGRREKIGALQRMTRS